MRRSRSPRRRPEHVEEAFSISSLSDVSAGELIERRGTSKRYNSKFDGSRRRHRERKNSQVSEPRAKSEHEVNVPHFQNNPDMFADPSIFEYPQSPSYQLSPGSYTNGRNDKRSVNERGKRNFEDREHRRSTSDRHDWEPKDQKELGEKRSFNERIEYRDRRHTDEQLARVSKRDERINSRDSMVGKSLKHSDRKSVDRGSGKSDDRIDRLERMVELLVQNKSQTSTNLDSLQENNLEVGDKHTNVSTSLWLNKINEYCLDRNYDDSKCIEYLQSKMSGLMKAWFKTLNTFQYTWPELKMLITKTFPDTFDFACTLRLLVGRTKQPDETVTQYYFAKMYLIEQCKISGVNAVSCLIDGLNDSYLQKQAKDYTFLTPETLYSQFLVNIPNYGLTSQLPIPEQQIDGEYSEINMVYSQPPTELVKPSREMKKKKCFTCGKFGHIAEVCRHAPVCYNCRERGHIAVKCPNV